MIITPPPSIKTNQNKLLKRSISILTTFYISYLFVHFVILNLYALTNTTTIIGCIMLGHFVLNSAVIFTCKSPSFGDVLMNIKYQNIHNRSLSTRATFMRSMLSFSLLYSLIFLNYKAGFAFHWVVLSIISSALISGLNFQFKSQQLSLIDWVTQTKIRQTSLG